MAVSRIHFDKQKYIKDTLEELKTLSDYEIQMQLEKIAILTKQDKFPIYPICKRTKDEDGNIIVIEKEFERKDGREIVNTLISKMFSFLYEESCLISQLSDDILGDCDTLRYLDSEGSLEDKDELLKNFDNKFSFLLEVDTYSNIYIEFRKDYIRLLEKSIRYSYSKKMLDKEYSDELMFYLYLPPDTYRRALQKHKKNKPTRNK